MKLQQVEAGVNGVLLHTQCKPMYAYYVCYVCVEVSAIKFHGTYSLLSAITMHCITHGICCHKINLLDNFMENTFVNGLLVMVTQWSCHVQNISQDTNSEDEEMRQDVQCLHAICCMRPGSINPSTIGKQMLHWMDFVGINPTELFVSFCCKNILDNKVQKKRDQTSRSKILISCVMHLGHSTPVCCFFL